MFLYQPQRRVFLVKIWMTEVTDEEDSETRDEERIIHCDQAPACHLCKQEHHKQNNIKTNIVDSNNNSINEHENFYPIKNDSYETGYEREKDKEGFEDFEDEEGYETFDELAHYVS